MVRSMSIALLLNAFILASLIDFGVSQGVVTCGPDAPQRWTLTAPEGWTFSTGARCAGAVDSIVVRGKQYINACDHGRELQMAVTTVNGECYNPTEAGAENDQGGAATTSQLLGVNTSGNVLRTTSNPAFWLWPGTCGDPGCGCAVNKQKVSQYTMDKALSFNPYNIPYSMQYLADVHVPEAVPHLQLESPTAYQTGDFNKFYSINPTTGALTYIPTPGQGQIASSNNPLILATQDDQHAMCAISAAKVDYYALFDFSGLQPSTQSTTKWTIVREFGALPAGTLISVNTFICVGTTAEVQRCLVTMARNINGNYTDTIVNIRPYRLGEFLLPTVLKAKSPISSW